MSREDTPRDTNTDTPVDTGPDTSLLCGLRRGWSPSGVLPPSRSSTCVTRCYGLDVCSALIQAGEGLYRSDFAVA